MILPTNLKLNVKLEGSTQDKEVVNMEVVKGNVNSYLDQGIIAMEKPMFLVTPMGWITGTFTSDNTIKITFTS